jgi:hypothetical protein
VKSGQIEAVRFPCPVAALPAASKFTRIDSTGATVVSAFENCECVNGIVAWLDETLPTASPVRVTEFTDPDLAGTAWNAGTMLLPNPAVAAASGVTLGCAGAEVGSGSIGTTDVVLQVDSSITAA